MKKKFVKIGELAGNAQLVGRLIQIPKYVLKKQFELKPVMRITSGWGKGLWCIMPDEKSHRIFPVFFENADEVKEWKVEQSMEDMFDALHKNGSKRKIQKRH